MEHHAIQVASSGFKVLDVLSSTETSQFLK